jgi:putative endonuclease
MNFITSFLRTKKLAYIFGHLAEYFTIFSYWIYGYKLLHKRYKTPLGEIDLILKRGDVVVFVEVKFRSIKIDFDIISYKQRNRLQKAMNYYLSNNKKYFNYALRQDVALISFSAFPTFIQNINLCD